MKKSILLTLSILFCLSLNSQRNANAEYWVSFTYLFYFAQRRKIESWFFWILGDVISVPLYFVKGLAFSSFQYLIFTLIAVAGYYKWKSIYNNKKRIA